MSIGQKRPIRTRVWASDEAPTSRSVGENMRDIAGAIDSLPRQRFVTIQNQFYTDGGLVFSSPARPTGIVNVYSETVDGTVSTSLLSGMTFDKGVVTVKFATLIPGVRYTTIRLQVFG
jgi:hypothetical protein